MPQCNANARQCATCQFWGGPRSIAGMGHLVECDTTAEGVCSAQGRMGNKCKGNAMCGSYAKWASLR